MQRFRAALLAGLCIVSVLLPARQVLAASGLEVTPAQACAALQSARLDAGSYADMGDGQYQCRSRKLRLPFGDPEQNEVSYRVSGAHERVTRIELSLEVYTRRELQASLGRLRDLGDSLVQALFGAPLEAEIAATLLAAGTGEWVWQGMRLELRRNTASGHRGFRYTLRLE